jgi:hypothetical protein
MAGVLLSVSGCMSVPDQASCDHRPKEQVCTDLLENKNDQTQSLLEGLCVGTYSNDLCTRTGALGGCKCTGCENGSSIRWLFPDPVNDINTAEDVMAACDEAMQTFVAP